MIAGLHELMRWPRTPLASGGVLLTAPHDPSATLRIQPGRRPLCSLRALASTRAGDATPLGPIRRITTEAGEHAAMISLRVSHGAAPSTRIIAVAIGDGEYTLIEGTARDPEIGLVVEQLLRSRVHAASPRRARMVAYRPPAGWLGLARPLATCWLAPRYPRDRSRLVVCDAIPLASAAALTQQLLWPLEVPPGACTDQIGRAPLHGQLVRWERDGAISAIADLADRAFRYRVQLHDGNAGALAALRDVVASLEPITLPAATATRGSSELFAWLS